MYELNLQKIGFFMYGFFGLFMNKFNWFVLSSVFSLSTHQPWPENATYEHQNKCSDQKGYDWLKNLEKFQSKGVNH